MRGWLRILTSTAQEFGERTTIHGLLHMTQSTSRIRKALWLVLLAAALSFGLYHTVQSVKKCTESTVTSQLRLMSEEATFPDVTICNLQPASASMTRDIEAMIHIQDKWNSFNDWFQSEKRQRKDESRVEFRERFRKICRRLFQVMYVSGDASHISHSDRTMLIQCNFNGEPCNHHNFSLLKSSKFWNCYTFNANGNHTSSGVLDRGASLDLMLFTDNYNKQHGLYRSNLTSSWPKSYKIKDSIDGMDDCVTKYMIEKQAFNLALRSASYDARGLRIFIHNRDIYPLHSSDYLNVPSGSKSQITISPIRNVLIPGPTHKCVNAPNNKVSYVKNFIYEAQTLETKKYTKTLPDLVTEAKQDIIFENCGCYSHQYAIRKEYYAKLCYFVPLKHWKSPTDTVLRNIRCHDKWIKVAEKKHSELSKKLEEQRQCEYTKFRPSRQSSSWPQFEDVAEIWNDLLVPIMTDSSNDSDPEYISREKNVFIGSLLIYTTNPCINLLGCNVSNLGEINCDLNDLNSRYKDAAMCIERDTLAKNMVALRVNLQSSMSDVYVEEPGYHWTEALSEIGGALGLWVGISLLSPIELLELIYVLIRNCLFRHVSTVRSIDN